MRAWLFVLVFGCSTGSNPTSPPPPAAPAPVAAPVSKPAAPTALAARKDVSVDQLYAAVQEGAKVIDVRTPGEYASGHVPGAVNIPMSQLDPLSAEAWPKDQPVYLICAVGGRSQGAADRLAKAGYDARNVLGGTQAWRAKGFPVE